jgi:hypothetical protein
VTGGFLALAELVRLVVEVTFDVVAFAGLDLAELVFAELDLTELVFAGLALAELDLADADLAALARAALAAAARRAAARRLADELRARLDRSGRFQSVARSARKLTGIASTPPGSSITASTAASARSFRTSAMTLLGRRARAA